MSPVANRLVRLLNMVPYFQANPRVSYAKAAADLGVSRKQLDTDIKQLWMCGLPGYSPGDLIDFELSDGTIKVTFSAGMDRPLRLTSTEATGLLIALRALADIPGVVDPAAARSAIAKIEAAAGAPAGRNEATGGRTPAGRSEATGGRTPAGDPTAIGVQAAAVREAVRDRRAVSIEYYSASRDALSTRVVDPIRVVLVGDHSYLEAWCRQAEGVRLFRFDRIVDAHILDEPAAAPHPAATAPPNTALFDADPSLPSATLRIAPRAAWVLEYFPMRVLPASGFGSDVPDGSCVAEMTYAAEEWMARLILGFGADVTVLGPASLAERVRNSATEALAAYRELAAGNIETDVEGRR
ncbi:MAG: YafY family transcriptional regulator [Mycobacterium sp.]|nr:YafY family transcriptional regulator [Mycobacterium sp.]